MSWSALQEEHTVSKEVAVHEHCRGTDRGGMAVERYLPLGPAELPKASGKTVRMFFFSEIFALEASLQHTELQQTSPVLSM